MRITDFPDSATFHEMTKILSKILKKVRMKHDYNVSISKKKICTDEFFIDLLVIQESKDLINTE